MAIEILEDSTESWFQTTPTENASGASQAIVLAPVRDQRGQLVAAIYGVRNTVGANRRRGVRPLEARLVQLLAESVAVGIARIKQETEATRTRVLLEHAFSPTVAEYIQQHPESLLGQERNVTLMFADLRGYTTLAETLALTDCYELLGDVMEALTQIVVQQRGVVVDYYGDGLLALWNAPVAQANHADLACAAALQMFDVLPDVGQAWQDRLNGPLELGIGIHSGAAYVGNAGTRSRIKYGPRGNTVNIASRVQAASKQLQLPLVITAATQTKLSDKFFTLRVCTAKLPGLERPAELFTAYPASEAQQVKSRLDEYSQALALFESGELEQAEELLNQLTSMGQATPARFLAHYTAAQKNGNLGRRAVDKYATGQGPVIEIHSK
jgi:class 3 adenylate cyclase